MSMKVSPKQEDEQVIAVNDDDRGLSDQENNVDVESEVNEEIVSALDDNIELINDNDMEKGRVTRVDDPHGELDDAENLEDEKAEAIQLSPSVSLTLNRLMRRLTKPRWRLLPILLGMSHRIIAKRRKKW